MTAADGTDSWPRISAVLLRCTVSKPTDSVITRSFDVFVWARKYRSLGRCGDNHPMMPEFGRQRPGTSGSMVACMPVMCKHFGLDIYNESKTRDRGDTQVVRCLPHRCEDLSSDP